MQSIRELLEVSAYEPEGGYSLDLVKMVKAGLDRGDALRRWVSMGRTEGSFYKAYKVLKDDLIRLAFLNRKEPGLEGKRLEILERYKVVRQLLVTGKKKSAISIAIDLTSQAQKAGFTDIVVSLSSILEEHFGCIEIDTRRYLRYRKIRKDYSQMLDDEIAVKSLKAKLAHCIDKKKDIKELEQEIVELIAQKSPSFTFMRYRFTILSNWFELKGDLNGLIKAFRETLDVYETCEVEFPSAALTNLYYHITPILSKAGKYAEAEAHLARALQTTTKEGAQNWHMLMLQRACLGFDSGKPGMVLGALKAAQAAPREHDNPKIDKSWALIGQILEGHQVEDVWKAVF